MNCINIVTVYLTVPKSWWLSCQLVSIYWSRGKGLEHSQIRLQGAEIGSNVEMCLNAHCCVKFLTCSDLTTRSWVYVVELKSVCRWRWRLKVGPRIPGGNPSHLAVTNYTSNSALATEELGRSFSGQSGNLSLVRIHWDTVLWLV